MKFFQLAIDGPVAAGKGTLSRLVAQRLGFLYVDTGATYRVATLIAYEQNFDWQLLDQEDPKTVSKLCELLSPLKIEERVPNNQEQDGRLITVIVDGRDVSWDIRQEKISAKVSIVSKLKKVREIMVSKQQEIAASTDVVMEGRDITYRVLPDAQLKIYLDASPEERARRRIAQLKEQGLDHDEEQVKKDILMRDRIDSSRETDPLKIIPEAWHFDVTDLTVQEAVSQIVAKVETLRGT